MLMVLKEQQPTAMPLNSLNFPFPVINPGVLRARVQSHSVVES
jgi:hypothetical protein